VREAARRRLLALVDPALIALDELVRDTDPEQRRERLLAARDILDRAGLGQVKRVRLGQDEEAPAASVVLVPWTAAEASTDVPAGELPPGDG
jgi:hypothetical protein